MDKKREWNYLFDVIRYSLTGGICPEIEEAPDWEYLYKICKKHKIESMVSNGLSKMPEEQQPPEEIRQKFRKMIKLDMAKEAVQHFSLEELLDEFEEKGVDCMPLKGALLKQFYENPALRVMSDLDILYRSEQKEQVHQIMIDLGYESESEGDHHDAYLRLPYMNMEMHHCLVSEESNFAPYYHNLWDRLSLQEGKKHIYEFSWEDYYIYMLVHLAKHFQIGGSGIRSVVDIWIFMREMQDKLNWEYLNEELKKVGLKDFDTCMRKLALIWFEGEAPDDFYEELTAYVVDSGVYGTMKNYRIQAVLEKNGDKDSVARGELGVKMEIIFLPLKNMKPQYPYLEKYPILLPVAWVQRIFRTIFKRKGRASQALRSAEVNQTEAIKHRDLFKNLGI